MPTVLVETGHRLSTLLGKQDEFADRRELIAEIHDFLAMLEGIKPVLLHGRGLAPSHWMEEVLKIAYNIGLCVIKGPFWDATTYGEFPDWYANHCRKELQPHRAWYICKDTTIAESVRRVNDAAGHLSVSEEARLIGYPECCVKAHYERSRRYHWGTLAILERLANGDEKKMQNLFTNEAHLVPVTQQELNDFEMAFDIREPKLGSWNLCHACARGTNSPSEVLSQQYYDVVQKAEFTSV